jgi:UDP-N-acetylmuramate dehydrogenase
MREYTDEPMSAHTSFRVGGPADKYCIPDSIDELRLLISYCRDRDIPYYVVGNGSNLLVSDKGYRGYVIEIGTGMNSIRCDGCSITAEAGALLSVISQEAKNHALTGMEFASGIPGCLGGAVVMNAGAYGGEMKNILTSVMLMDEKGTIFRETPQELELGYRYSNIPERGLVVLEADISLQPGDKEAITACMHELAQQRRSKQPLEYPSAGSTFKRPEGYYAGKLISDAGLKGYTVGGAQVSEKHAGFVVNRGGASAGDILAVIDHVKKVVEDRFGVTLEPEVKLLGEI